MNAIKIMFTDEIFSKILSGANITPTDDLVSDLMMQVIEYQTSKPHTFPSVQDEVNALTAIAKLRIQNIMNDQNTMKGSQKANFFKRKMLPVFDNMKENRNVSSYAACVCLFDMVQSGDFGETAKSEIKNINSVVMLMSGEGSSSGTSLNVESDDGETVIDFITTIDPEQVNYEIASASGSEMRYSKLDGGISCLNASFIQEAERVVHILSRDDLSSFANKEFKEKNIKHYIIMMKSLVNCKSELTKLNFTELKRSYDMQCWMSEISPLTFKSEKIVNDSIAFFTLVNPDFKHILKSVIYKSDQMF